jgi:branched-chain amino acid transport system substrate-binding protein
VGGFNRDRKDHEGLEFMKEFKKRAGYPPENVSANSYSAVMLMADAIKRAGTDDSAKVRAALAATKNFPHLNGNLSHFNSLGEMNRPMNVNVVKGGKFKYYTTIDDLEILRPPEK